MGSVPFIIGHRGAKAEAPENTLASMQAAVKAGAKMIEVDVKLSKDNVAFITHDEALERTSNGTGLVVDQDWADLQKLDCGNWFDPTFKGTKFATLQECLELVLDHNIQINLEIKPCPGREIETAQLALKEAFKLWPADRPAPLISSFDWPCLEVAQQIVPNWKRGLLMEENLPNWQAEAKRLGAFSINVDDDLQNEDSIKLYKSLGHPVLVFTVNDVARAKQLKAWGVDAIFTDDPAKMIAAGL